MTTDQADPQRLGDVANMASGGDLARGLDVAADRTASVTLPFGKTVAVESVVTKSSQDAAHH